MKIQLSPLVSDVFIALYLLGTLLWRFLVQPQLDGFYLVSLGIGLFFLLFLWALVKSKFLNPTWFGLAKRLRE